MAYILRSLAIIGTIALNSPVHGGKSNDGAGVEAARTAFRTAAKIDPKTAANGLMAAREAAEILAGLEPATRERFLAATTASLAPKGDPSASGKLR
ncbi:hypothetical protein [Bosea sp. PAMC 26642]|uniref:hypothetical protein n=1 Tax=Bosea sp. (strain PAMC 26642) TaxID=1792307 RepID=UPI00076FE542|nr:hypothetical protein [Bosea sp. PAMC 26642]AMJ59051.1 hypothetical protein AXW83_00945 [Bosea sp. PAMC 26642]